jgi:hypothetical protein
LEQWGHTPPSLRATEAVLGKEPLFAESIALAEEYFHQIYFKIAKKFKI